MRVCIHRGSNQIGGNCVELESLGQRLLVDLGLPLDAEENSPEYLPNVNGLDGKDSSLLGVLISHAHLDHFGLLAHISQTIPVGMGPAARKIIEAASPFLPGKWTTPAKGWDYRSGETFQIGNFYITPFLIDHSAYDSYILMIESDGKRVFYSGDLRAHGRKSALFDHMIQDPPKNIDVLFLEGSSLGRLDIGQNFPSETDLEEQLTTAFHSTNGLVLVHASSQNIDRIVSILRACKRSEKKLIIDLYTAVILEATGNLKIPQSNWADVCLYIPQSQRVKIKQKGWFELLKHHSSNRIFLEDLEKRKNESVMLFRPLHCPDLEKSHCLEGATYIYSQWEGYWEGESFRELRLWLKRNNIPKIRIHTSGHASLDNLRDFSNAINPKKVVPIHTFFPECYPKLFSNVEIHKDNEWWEV